MPDKNLDVVLKFDPLAEAEKLTGVSYKDSEATSYLGFSLAMDHNKMKNEELRSRGDTTLSNKLGRYKEIITSAGFELCVRDEVNGRPDGDDVASNEAYYIYAHRDGLLLAFDTYFDETTVNGGKVYYNWTPAPDLENRWSFTSSGSMADIIIDGETVKVWYGDHDCREAILHNLNNLREHGRFVPQWLKPPHLYLMSFMDWDEVRDLRYPESSEAINKITAERISRCPQWVQDMVG